MSQKLLTSTEAADLLGIEPQTLAVWRLHSKNLPFLKIGRLVRYRAQDIEAWLASRRVEVAGDGATVMGVGQK